MKRKLSLESLETKEIPSGGGTVIQPGIYLNAAGTLSVYGDANDQIVSVWNGNDNLVHASLGHMTYVPDGNGGQNAFPIVDVEKSFAVDKVNRIRFHGREGDDKFTNDTGLPSTAYGEAGNDELVGGSGRDILIGSVGDDVLEGRGWNDDLRGGGGSDAYVFQSGDVGAGGLGSDTITEAANLDTDRLMFDGLTGATGVHIHLGDTVTQTVKGSYLKLTLSSGLGIEEVWGTEAGDWIYGNGRPNTLLGLGGKDTMQGGGGADFVDGGAGNDSIHGGTGNDTLIGCNGNDKLYADENNDSVDGGDGNDFIDGWTGNDTLTGGNDNDTIQGAVGSDKLYGGLGNDLLEGGADPDTLEGGSGNDDLFGHTGNDVLTGDSGDDELDGGLGKDTMDGGSEGYDSLFADQGNENLSNGEHVEITVPNDSPQNDNWSCGPNSASRLLRSYGINASYSALKTLAKQTNIITDFGLGTPPPYLLQVLQKYRPESQMKSDARFAEVLTKLGEGRPVIALIGWGEIPIFTGNPIDPIDMVPAGLHYICLTGYDMDAQKIYFTDTNGEAKSYSFETFQQRWNFAGDGLAYEGMKALGITKQTILW
jgi:Ca2+-binding RTX toxin-like protein